MAQLIVRNIESDVKERLQRRAARRGRSMEEEVRAILRDAASRDDEPATGLGSEIAALFNDDSQEPLPEYPRADAHAASFDE